MDKVVQIGVVGAMQRAHPALTQLWLQWTGVPNLEWATFNMGRAEQGSMPVTNVDLSAKFGAQETWTQFGDVLGLPEDCPERRRMPIHLGSRAPFHKTFWEAMKRREMEEVDGPIEWWWRLMVLRYKGAKQASAALIRTTIGDDKILNNALVSFQNPSLKAGHRASRGRYPILIGPYRQPTHLIVSLRVKRGAAHQGLAFAFSDATFRGRFVSRLIDLAVSRS